MSKLLNHPLVTKYNFGFTDREQSRSFFVVFLKKKTRQIYLADEGSTQGNIIRYNKTMTTKSKLLRMDNVLIVVEDLDAVKAFFLELGMELEGEMTVEGPWVDQTVGLKDVRSDIVVLRTPDGHGKVELSKFQTPPAIKSIPENAPSNTLGLRRIMFAVENIDEVVSRLQSKHGATLFGEIAQYENMYRLCFMRGPEGIIIGLAQAL